MAQQHLNVGTTANDGTGDTLRASQIKVEANFDELYARPDFTDAPSDGNIYGRKDGTWEQVTGGGTTPTLQEVTDEGNTTKDGIVLTDNAESGFTKIYNEIGTALSVLWNNGFKQHFLNDYATADRYVNWQDKDYDGVADMSDIPTTATDVNALSRNGDNANADVDLGTYRIRASEIVTKNSGDIAKSMALKGNNLTAEHVAEWQDMDYTGIADISQIPNVSGKEDISNKSSSYTASSTTTYANTKALVDGLATKQDALSYTPYKFVQTSQTAHTGTLSETIVATATISGGTYNSNDVMKAIFKATKTATTSNVTMRLRINTSNSLSGATQIAILTFTTANLYAKMKRDFDLNGGNLYAYSFASSLASDDTNVNTLASSTAYNTANTLYFFWTLQLGTSGDSVIPNLANLTN